MYISRDVLYLPIVLIRFTLKIWTYSVAKCYEEFFSPEEHYLINEDRICYSNGVTNGRYFTMIIIYLRDKIKL